MIPILPSGLLGLPMQYWIIVGRSNPCNFLVSLSSADSRYQLISFYWRCPREYQNNTRFQKERPKNISNYRAISVLSCFLNCFARISFNHFQAFIYKYYILSIYPFGLRKHHSTCLALTNLFKNISSFLIIKILLLEFSTTCLKHLTPLITTLWHTQSCLRLDERVFPR